MAEVFGESRTAVMARELTKLHETLRQDSLGALCEFVAADSNQRKGEFVILVAGKIRAEDELAPETARILQLLLEEMPTKKRRHWLLVSQVRRRTDSTSRRWSGEMINNSSLGVGSIDSRVRPEWCILKRSLYRRSDFSRDERRTKLLLCARFLRD